MYTSGKKRTSFFGEYKVQRKRWKPENRILKSGKATYGIRNPRMWNPESTGMESGIHSVESGIQDSLGLPYMGR